MKEDEILRNIIGWFDDETKPMPKDGSMFCAATSFGFEFLHWIDDHWENMSGDLVEKEDICKWHELDKFDGCDHSFGEGITTYPEDEFLDKYTKELRVVRRGFLWNIIILLCILASIFVATWVIGADLYTTPCSHSTEPVEHSSCWVPATLDGWYLSEAWYSDLVSPQGTWWDHNYTAADWIYVWAAGDRLGSRRSRAD